MTKSVEAKVKTVHEVAMRGAIESSQTLVKEKK
jgi:hypothetical protein